MKYQTPPKDIMDLALAKPTPSVLIDNKAEWMLLLDRSDFPTIEELAQPELRIAGLRINPNNFSPTRSGSSTNIQFKNIKANKVFDIEGLPKELSASGVQWSPDQTKFAFIHSTNTQADLYVVDVMNKKAKKINKSFSIPFTQLISFDPYSDGLGLQKGNSSYVLNLANNKSGEVTFKVLTNAINRTYK